MPNCHLIIDSCCDLPFNMVDIEGIELLKFSYEMNGATYSDDLFQSLTPSEFYDAMRKGALPTTSQLSVPLLEETFERAAIEGVPSVYLSFSSGLSGSYDVAMMVRERILERYPDFELYIVDTVLASIAEALLVFEAINQWQRGLSAKELAQWAEEAKYFIDEAFMVDDLDTLRRGGRIGSTVAAAGTALDVKPILTIDEDGKLQIISIARGRKKAIKQLVDYYSKNASDKGSAKYVVLGNSDCPKDQKRLREMLEKIDDSIIFIESSIGPVIGSHVGPDMLALVFWGNDKREKLSVADRIAKKVKGDN